MTRRRKVRRLLCAVFTAALAGFSAVQVRCDEKKPQKQWSVKWEELWIHGPPPEKCFRPFDQRLASTADVVALALMRTCGPLQDAKIAPIQKKHYLQVFFLDGRTGKVLAKYTPKTAVVRFELFATASGNFLVTEASYSEATKTPSTSLRVLSPEGKTIRTLGLEHVEKVSRKIGWEVFLSPSRRTVIAVWPGFKQTIYRVFGTDALAPVAEWTTGDVDEPEVFAVSDSQLLGVRRGNPRGQSYSETLRSREVLISGFDPNWQALPHLPTHERRGYLQYAFLTQNMAMRLEIPPDYRGVSSASITVFQTTGTVQHTQVIKESSWHDLWAESKMAISSDGNLFAVGISRTNRFLAGLDFYPRHSEVFLFRKDNLQRVMRIDNSSTPSSFCLSTDGSAFVILNGQDLSSYIVSSATRERQAQSEKAN